MNAVITLGIDMSSQPEGTAACAVSWEIDRAVVASPCLGCNDEVLDEMNQTRLALMRRLAGQRHSQWLWVHGSLPLGTTIFANGSVSGRKTALCTKVWAAGR